MGSAPRPEAKRILSHLILWRHLKCLAWLAITDNSNNNNNNYRCSGCGKVGKAVASKHKRSAVR